MNKSAPLIKKEITDGLVSRWQFGEGTGTTVSDSWGSNDGTSSGGMTWEEGKVDTYSGGFDDVDDFVTIAHASDINFSETTPFTFSAWIKTTASDGDNAVLSKMTAGFKGIRFITRSGKLALGFVYTWPTIRLRKDGATSINDGNWHYVVATYAGAADTSSINLYTDGALDNGSSEDTLASNSVANTDDMWIGREPSSYFDGDIDDVRVYDRVLSASEIKTIYDLHKEPLDGLVSRYVFNEGSGTAVGDSGSGGNDGTASGGMTWETGKVNNYAGGFDGVNDYVNLSKPSFYDSNVPNLTWSLWGKLNSSGTSDYLISNSSASGDSGGLCIHTNGDHNYRVAVFLGAPPWWLYLNGSVTDVTEWHHLAVTFENLNVKFFIDGAEVDSSTLISNLDMDISDTEFWLGGSDSDHFGAGYLDGHIDDVRIYDRTLSATEILTIYNKYK